MAVLEFSAMIRKARIKLPVPAKKPQKFVTHGDVRIDEYAWIRDDQNPEVQKYIAAENAYADAFMKPTSRLQKELYTEIKKRMKEDDMSVPVKDGPYYYYTRTKKGRQYAIHCRKNVSGGREQIILDENKLAKGNKYFSLGDADVNGDHTLLAYTVDTTGAEKHALFIKDLATGNLLGDTIEAVGDFEWSEDGRYLFYTREEHPHPPRKVFRHALGTDTSADELLYEESDLQWYVSIGKSSDRKYLFIYAANFDATEVRYIKSDEPLSHPILLVPRKKEVKCFVEHYDKDFYILTNERAVNFKIMRVGETESSRKKRREWMPHKESRAIIGLQTFQSFFAVLVRENGAEEVYIHAPGKATGKRIELPESAHALVLWSDLEFESPFIRLTYQSLLTPRIVYDYDITKRTLVTRKKQEVPGWKSGKFTSERIWAPSFAPPSHKAAGGRGRASQGKDKVRIPISLAYKRTTKLNGTAPLFIEGYGSYGISSDPYFSISKASLLERGWVVATVHPRGGGEMGWSWHKQAKLMTKHRTYEDVIACVDALIKKGYGVREKTALVGGSAGGMMVGAVLNMRPDLVGGAIAYVPATDVVTSSLDESLGGTRLHYDETGDPRKPKMYRYLMRYSPYENIKKVDYPALLVRANMNDIRTPYWEAAKWVARLRAKKTDSNPLLLKTETVAGHFGKSGRYEWIKDRAFDFAFLMRIFDAR